MLNKIKLTIMSTAFAVQTAAAASGNGTSSEIKGLIGDPFTAIGPLKPLIQFLTGTTLGFFIVLALLAILIAGILGYIGHGAGSASMRNKGTSGILGVIYITALVVIALIVFIALITKFVLA